MFATLIIKNIGNLYTCDDKFTIFHHAFIAFHHDKIIDIGEHDYHKWIEPCTYIIDAASRAVIPGLIESNFVLPEGNSKWDVYRKAEEKIYYLQKSGTMTFCMNANYRNPNPLLMDVIRVDSEEKPLQSLEDCKYEKDYMLSCPTDIVSQHSLGSLMYYGYHEPEWVILKSMTCNVAKKYNLDDRGSLEIGKIGDVLVLNEITIKDYFKAMGRPPYARMIKKGIPVFPSFVRV